LCRRTSSYGSIWGCSRANAANTKLSDNLQKLFAAWMAVFPDPQRLRPPTAREAQFNLAEVDDLLSRCAGNYLDHREALENIPARRQTPALQVYFW
jgi:hypothetical protein